MKLKNQTVAVTGGAGGIGSLLCREFIRQGAKVVVIDRVDSLPFSAELIQGDLSSIEGIGIITEKLAKFDIDILVNLAGLQYFGPLEEQSPAHTALLFAVNLQAPVLMAQALIPSMKKRGHGQIVNIGSTFGSINFAHFATYSSSKAGLQGFSEALRREVKADGIDVTYIAPRAVNTPMNTDKILRFAKLVNMNMDEPEWVVGKITEAIINKRKDTYLGFPEKLFVRINAIFPRLVDWSLAANDKKAKQLF